MELVVLLLEDPDPDAVRLQLVLHVLRQIPGSYGNNVSENLYIGNKENREKVEQMKSEEFWDISE